MTQPVETVVFNTIRDMLERRSADVSRLNLDADLHEDLALDSLELAELSAVLEDEYGTDPYSAGVLPRTVKEVIAFYDDGDRP